MTKEQIELIKKAKEHDLKVFTESLKQFFKDFTEDDIMLAREFWSNGFEFAANDLCRIFEIDKAPSPPPPKTEHLTPVQQQLAAFNAKPKRT